MKPLLKKIGAFFARHYDKLVLLIAVAFLVWSGAAYVMGGKQLDQEQFAYKKQKAQLTPLHPDAQVVNVTTYDQAIAQLDTPFQAQVVRVEGTNEVVGTDVTTSTMLSPELRVTCPKCERPRPFTTLRCTFCQHLEVLQEDVEPVADPDLDADGLPGEWELAHGLDPRNALDANSDNDRDGFTALEEYGAKTDPTVFADHPALTPRIALQRIVAIPFRFQFKSRMVAPGGQERFFINDLRRKMTLNVTIGDKVGEEYRVEKYAHKTNSELAPGSTTMKTDIDVSELTLVHLTDKSKRVVLVKDQRSRYFEYGAVLVFTMDRSEYKVLEGGDFTLNGELHAGRVFTVKDVDSKKAAVLVRDATTGHEEWRSEGEGL